MIQRTTETHIVKKVDEEYYAKVGKKLGKSRYESGYTQKNIAKELGVTFQQYQKYENGVNRIPTKALAKFCEITGSDIREIAGVTLEDYEIRYKQNTINYYNSTYINNFNGLFSNFFNMDLKLMKNKIVGGTIGLTVLIYFIFALLKFVPSLNIQYNTLFLSFQFLVYTICFAVILFIIYGYSWIAYLVTFIAYGGVYSTLHKIIHPKETITSLEERLFMYVLGIALTFLTFYILKKLKINLPKSYQKKQEIKYKC